MKKYFLIVAWILVVIPAVAQDFNTNGAQSQAKQPTVMVVPYINAELDKYPEKLRTYIDTNPMITLCINKIEGAFRSKGYPTNSFSGQLRKLQGQAIISASKSASFSYAKAAVTGGKAEICVYIRPQVISNGDTREVRLFVQADAFGENFASVDFRSGPFRTNDSIALAEKALATISHTFFYQMEDSYNDMLTKGRSVSILIEFTKECEVGPYTEVGTEGKTLDEEMGAWAYNMALGNVGSAQSGDGVITLSMKSPVYEKDTHRAVPVEYFGRKLFPHLKKLIGNLATVEQTINQGQNVQFIIK